MKAAVRVVWAVGIALALVSLRGDAGEPGDRWKSVELWSNKTLTARMRYLPKASLADEDIVVVEFDNESGSTLDVSQVWAGAQTEKKSRDGKVVPWGQILGILPAGKLAPGVTTFEKASKGVGMNLGLPPRDGYVIDVVAHCEVHLSDGEAFSTPKEGVKFQMEWVYPSPAEIEDARKEVRPLLENPVRNDSQLSRLGALLDITEVSDSLTVDELLSALKSRPSRADGRDLIAQQIARRFGNDPKVVAYYLGELSTDDQGVMSDLAQFPIWDRSWIPPLVEKFEKKGDSDALGILGKYRKDWGADKGIVSRLSKALLKYRPLLSEKTSSLEGNGAVGWERNAYEAGVIGDPALIPILAPALDDTRVLKRPMSAEYPPDSVFRICDPALMAILMILDGNDAAAFKQAGVDPGMGEWSGDDKQRFAGYDRVIALTKERLKKMGDGGGDSSAGQ
ncbi:MAG TPA: hypothetical protein VG733_06490 [Chthoniobacteraceae bacterium]|nr:hypothetical protein [Chthoniobacteraceae bacterium]